MRVIKPSVCVEHWDPHALERIEKAGRTCYKSEAKITESSAERFAEMLQERGHESVLEHASVTVRFIVDRGVTHELVRHRLAAYSQESTRYCNYSKEKFGQEVTFIEPFFLKPCPFEGEFDPWHLLPETNLCASKPCPRCVWWGAMRSAELAYLLMLDGGATAQEARSVLPNSTKTEIVMTANLREWIHVLRLRTSQAAHPQMRQVMVPLLDWFKKTYPALFCAIEAVPHEDPAEVSVLEENR